MKRMEARRWGVAAIAGALVLAACTTGGESGDKGGGEGVPFGASKAEYQEAFEDVAPITIVAQTTGPKGLDTWSGSKEEVYMAAIEDWSGGKITFDISYAYAIAPIVEADNAISEGRLDMGTVMPSLEPSEYPVYNEFVKASFLAADGNPVVGPMLVNAYLNEVGYQIPEIAKEFEEHNMHVILPAFGQVPGGVFCTSKRASSSDFKGAIVSTTNSTVAQLLKSVGASPTSLPFNEAFEGLQRGAIDCTQTALSQSVSSGTSEPAPYAMTAGDASLGVSSVAFAMSKGAWDNLPLVAKQLFYDRTDVFLDNMVGGQIGVTAEGVELAQKNGGGVYAFDDTIQQGLRAEGQKVFETIRDTNVVADPDGMADELRKAHDKWFKIITDDLGIDPDLTVGDLPAWLEAQGGGDADAARYLDLSGSEIIERYLDVFGSEIIAKYRPS